MAGSFLNRAGGHYFRVGDPCSKAGVFVRRFAEQTQPHWELKSGDCPSHSVQMGIVAHGRQSETAVGRDSQGINLSPAIRPVRDD